MFGHRYVCESKEQPRQDDQIASANTVLPTTIIDDELKLAMDADTKHPDMAEEPKSSDTSVLFQNDRRASMAKITRTSSILMVLVSGLALFSDGYNAQIIGYMNPLFKQLYPNDFTPAFKTRLSNAYLVGAHLGALSTQRAFSTMHKHH